MTAAADPPAGTNAGAKKDAETEIQMTSRKTLYTMRLTETLLNVNRAVAHRDNREVQRALRRLTALRRTLHPTMLKETISAMQSESSADGAKSAESSKPASFNTDALIAGLTIMESLPQWQANMDPEPVPRPRKQEEKQEDAKDDKEKGKKKGKNEDAEMDDAKADVDMVGTKDRDGQGSKEDGSKEEGSEKWEERVQERYQSAMSNIKAGSYTQAWLTLLTIFACVDSYVETSKSPDVSQAQIQTVTSLLSTQGTDCCGQLLGLLNANAERPLDTLDAKSYFGICRVYDLNGRDREVRGVLHEAYRNACVERKLWTQATILNQLLQSYLNSSEHDLAVSLVSKTNFPENIRATTQLARCLFNLGRIQAVRMEYSSAHEKLMAAVGKLPPSNTFGRGFKLQVYQYAILVELLMGSIPEVSLFRQSQLTEELQSYEELMHAVRLGGLREFMEIFEKHQQRFRKDGTYFLVERLRHSVIATGLKSINQSYSKISLQDVANKLGINDAEPVLAKAIMDQVVVGSIDADQKILISSTLVNKAKTAEPAEAFRKRIHFCSNMYEEAMRAIQYPEQDALKQKALEAEERRRQKREEIDRALEEGFDDDEI